MSYPPNFYATYSNSIVFVFLRMQFKISVNVKRTKYVFALLVYLLLPDNSPQFNGVILHFNRLKLHDYIFACLSLCLSADDVMYKFSVD